MRWIVFDYGEVISKRTAALAELAEVVGADPAAFETAYWAHREAYDRGQPDLEYWSAVAGTDLDEPTSAQLTKIDTTGWLTTEQSTLDLIADIKAAGHGLALLSNAPSSFGRLVEVEAWSTQFAHLIFSGDLRIAKPDPEMWTLLLERLNAQPQDCVFFDDRQVNIDGATAAGIDAQLWVSAAKAREYLAAAGIL
ncbi:HAD family phosphatase [Kibdelosporangium philippinense]|uniref:HAD family phosphatase n=1 Tax=Kibdelosporangium philippinense TaxID=211113 RepID=A0ABS8ZCS2_9PSEU|nr:HAD family phosphatase [Kibdelosporangium philippinense]MCE7005312.1 HAD family phosphatase [Kibdelosporangium philippinense]